ncbi:hypothetical protein EC9_27110 [Rosistilla ulvae]|uniref:Sulfatase n=1 Tax=Rosistilla ulvae TaxID=1930277 RepID=A0A517M0W1_9BACT|nr:DUF1501 domain-containing protein [Rosistilla ulvae]QDS88520.1 hypothetical protein EC9_27110 [Rosistilla ulvae]
MFADTSHRDVASRRRWLQTCSSGFGMLALSSLQQQATAAPTVPLVNPKAKSVILCYMSGGVSHVDSFDPKPQLVKDHGKSMPVKVERTQFNNNGKIFGSPFAFKPYGESGLEISEIFPELGSCADHLAIVRSATTNVNEHAQGNFAIHTGFPFLGHPSAGAWISYGLGAANENLPSYVVLQSGGAVPPHGGVGLFSSGYLPAQHQASILQADKLDAVPNIRPAQSLTLQRQRLDFVRQIDSEFADLARNRQVDAAIENFETAFRMQSAVPEICDISDETDATMSLYGIDDPDPSRSAYGRQALLARKLVEQGVRFVELSCLTRGIGAGGAANPWDQHGDLEKGHRAMAGQVDRPIAALIKDLEARGLLDETLIVFTGEFGRTPFSQGSNGRDHNPFGFSLWLAGGGIRGGTTYGATDELGYRAVEKPCTIYDVWATVLHQLGIDHEKLTFRSGGRDFRLTDVHGNVLNEIIA